jgi:superfamily II DNA or RNA helicase
MSSSTSTGQAGDLRNPYALRRHQREALDAVDRVRAGGGTRAWVVLPPGAGKTLVGLETARRRGHRTVVLSPNTAIQAQWLRGWDELLPHVDHPSRAGSDRDLAAFFTALTYQSLATFLPDEEVDEEGRQQSLLARLHPNGKALVERLRAEPDLTVVLDECHHLLEVWGRLLNEVLAELPNAFVLGLTATPPATLTPAQAALVEELFGGIGYEASVPAVVREGHLAPFAEMAWLTTPSSRERDYITGQAERFAELVHGLTDPRFGSIGFLDWVDRRFVRATEGAVSWHRLVKDQPDLCDAALRLHHAGLVGLPDGARLLEQHRQAPSAEDWVALIDDWARRHLQRTGDPADEDVVDTIRRALPAVGYRWTRAGIRRGRSPVDRVLARSEAKADALAQIISVERRNLGARLRMLVLCDHEHVSSVLPVDLHGVMPAEAGSAQLALERLLSDPDTGDLSPLLVTGSRVAGAPETLKRLAALVAVEDPGLAARLDVEEADGNVAQLTGAWSSREWVLWATRFFEVGGSQVLIGTRALLGEGWDAPAVTGLVDLTTATTSTAVVQTRGRALRLDPRWPEKVAITWTVVCVTDAHPKGAADWERFVRKHQGFFGVDEHGDVVDGVAHVHDRFSPYAPPTVAELDECNGAMVVRSEDRVEVAQRWRVGEPYVDTQMHTLRVLPERTRSGAATSEGVLADPRPQNGDAASSLPSRVVLRPTGLDLRHDVPGPWRPPRAVLAGTLLTLGVLLVVAHPVLAAVVALAGGVLVQAGVAAARGRSHLHEVSRRPSIARVACAVADALRAAGMSPVGASSVRVTVDADGGYRCALDGVSPDVSALFATALDEVVSPMTTPRYVIPRYVADPPPPGPAGCRAGFAAANGLARPSGEVWHSVPTVLGVRAEYARLFASAWDTWVGGGAPVYTNSPEGEGILVTHRGSDPFDVTTALRLHWR